ncbi:MAG: manganese efflux pump MntP family protein [Eubacteriales bacterium]
MSFISLLFIAIALASDAFAAAVTFGLTKKLNIKKATIISLFFGGFQGFMTFLGWFCCLFFRDIIESFDHWIAFGLLTAIAINMIIHGKDTKRKVIALTLTSLCIISTATSIDALATGVSFSVLNINILSPASIIGIITFLVSFIGIYLGKKLKRVIKNEARLYYLSGGILIIIAFQILFEHLL